MLMKKDCSWGILIKIISDFKPKKKHSNLQVKLDEFIY